MQSMSKYVSYSLSLDRSVAWILGATSVATFIPFLFLVLVFRAKNNSSDSIPIETEMSPSEVSLEMTET